MPFDFLREALYKLPFVHPKAPPRACIVFLLHEPSELPLPVVQLAAERAWNMEFDGLGTGGNHVMRMGVVAIFRLGPEMLHLLTSGKPYGKEFSSRRMPKLPAGPLWAGHKAFLCFDNLTAGSMDAARFQQLGQLAAELLNANCIALFLPHLKAVIPNHAGLAARLRQFASWEDLVPAGDPPVETIEEDDPELVRAVAEARSRWPEFLEAFRTKTAEERFVVKAPFRDGAHCEWMWVQVERITGDEVAGELINQPVNVRSLRMGDEVSARAAEIGDWSYTRGGRDFGGFSLALFQ